MKKKLIGLALLCVLISVFTRGLTRTFFQQDEWNGFGYVIQLSQGPWWGWFNLLGPSHFIPLSQFYWFMLYRFFGYQSWYYAVNAIVLHSIAAYGVYLFAKKISGDSHIPILTSVLFAINSRAAQAFTHLAIFPATLTSFIVIITFLLYLSHVTKQHSLRKIHLAVLLGLFFCAVFLREDGLLIPVLLPAYVWLFAPKVGQRKNWWFFAIFYVFVLGFFGFRAYIQSHADVAISVGSGSLRKVFIYNALSLPFKVVVQNIIEGYDLFNVVWLNKQLAYPEFAHQITINLMFTVVYDFAVFAVFSVFTWIFFAATRSIKESKFWNAIRFSVVWIIAASVLLAVLGRPLNVVESRYLYLTSFPVLFIVSSTLVYVFCSPVKSVILQAGKRIFVIAVIMWMVVMSYKGIQALVSKYVYWSQARIHILSDLMRLYPTIPRDAIFYVTCLTHCTKNIDKFGVPNELVLPFTSGPGWIFMLQYAKNDEASFAPFFAYENGKQFLWDYAAEGYKKIGDRGFGYFISKPLLIEALRTNNLRPDMVIGLGYDDRNFSLRDISPSVREEILHDIATMSGIMK